ncbi:peptidoglycan-binding protein [Brasilonema octagenarum UFV-E1]|uniref:Peptidoglycan-binding protein n=2 Tax=Brasilonema TaxID=383614 RepID=A0A856M9W4_9CYAN|nr:MULTISPECIES: peptidoglycan-binding protein [Brasilonema]NMF67141.1 peptidoglycan-binding protein [Brasilonema octagenarum UFV-OR1]QDL06809.1 peptidoglycan-binding protein [Brasilonema sennae CENA114]QDL13175.1 peptidoglycan-binding protein [Brasilonema octagenarum UFV-E1]
MSDTTQTKIVVLQKGSTGPEVTDLQYILQIRKFTLNAPDGIFGPRTEAAVIQFQKSKNLKQDGVVGLQTWAAMQYAWPNNQPGTFLREGDSGNAVRLMQEAMVSKGINPGQPDGKFGPRTKAAVIEFQKNGDGERDSNIVGVVGPLTWGGILGD